MKTSILKILLVATMLATSTQSFSSDSDPLARRASWGAQFERTETNGIRIRQLAETSGLRDAGLMAGDTLVTVDGQSITGAGIWSDLTDALVAGRDYTIGFKRNHETQAAIARFDPLPIERYEGISVTYDQITSDFGIRQRVIITRPERSDGSQPAIFVVGGLSCSSIEHTPGRQSNFIRSLQGLVANSGMVVMRVEKPGLGDSEGNCSKTDFLTELNGYEVALKKLKSLPYVDPDRVMIYGSSMGSALAPYFANKFDLNAVIADGTWYRTWFEHMLEIERRIKRMQGLSEREINHLINKAYIPLYYGMLVEKKSYGQVIAEQPLLAEHNYHGADHMYGRPMAFYHQMQDFDIAGNWASLSVPVRIRWGTNDWIMSEYDNDMIIELLTAKGHPDAELFKFPGLDHWDTIHETASDSFNGEPGVWDDRISTQLVDWARELNSSSHTSEN